MKIKNVFYCCTIVLIVLFIPVSADPITITVTRVIITQNSTPITSAVNYTMDCYGHSFSEGDSSWLAAHKIVEIQNSSGTENSRYSYSAHCNPGRCDIYEYYDTWMMAISHCDISGVYEGHPFIIRNFSRDPLPPNCISMHLERWNDGFRYCMDEQCHKTLDPDEARASSRYCELNFDISQSTDPSADTISSQNSSVQSGSDFSPDSTIQIQPDHIQNVTVQSSLAPTRGLVESFYCSVLKFFNVEC